MHFIWISILHYSHTYQRKELKDFSKEAIAKIEDKNAKQGIVLDLSQPMVLNGLILFGLKFCE